MDARDALLSTARRDELHHALILHGPSMSLLETIAVDLACALNCVLEKDPEALCPACSKIRRDLHPDVHRVTVESTRKMISIEQVRTMISEATLRPFEGRTKVFIVSPADGMSTQAANSLLKTLEEPTRSTVFLLLTTSADRLLPTIRSRAQSILLRPVIASVDEIGRDGRSLQEARLRAGATSGEDAEKRSEFGREALSLLGRAAEGDAFGVIELAASIAALEEPQWGARLVAQILRDLAGESVEETLDPDAAQSIADAIPADTLLRVARGLLDRAEWSHVNPDPRMQFEAPLIDLLIGR